MIVARASGRTSGSPNCRQRELESLSQAFLTVGSTGVL